MKTCLHCDALQPLEALLCSACDNYLGLGRSGLGTGLMLFPPAVERAVGRGPYDKVNWGVVTSRATPTQLRVDVRWRAMSDGTQKALVYHDGSNYVLSVTPRFWIFSVRRKVEDYVYSFQIKKGTHSDMIAAKAVIETALKDHLTTILKQTGS